MATKRQLFILNLIVETFIKTGQAVSSQTILENNNLEMSSATIRNEMVFLEKENYIEKAYKSAGRVPTNKGYEYFLKNIKENPKSIEFLKLKLEKILSNRNTNIDETINKALTVINNATNTLSISREDYSDIKLEDMKIYNIENNKFIILIVLSNGKVINKDLFIKNINFEELQVVINVFSERLRGTKIFEIKEKAYQLKKIIFQRVKNLEDKFQDIIRLIFENIVSTSESYQGTSSLIKSDNIPVKHLQKILEIVENKTIWKILKQNEKIKKGNTSISLGINELENVSIINKDIRYGENKKLLTIVGSKQQDYGKLFALLNFLEKQIKGKKYDRKQTNK